MTEGNKAPKSNVAGTAGSILATGATPEKPRERFTIGSQPCQNFLRGDADIPAFGVGNRRNLHQCPKCCGHRAYCDYCCSDHHDGGWETCKPAAYDYREEDE